MAVGDKSRLTDEVTEAYRAAGVSHLLVVSGLHLTLLCGAFLGNRPCGGQFRKQKALAAMLLVLCMMALVGFTPSVTRAGVGALIFYTGAFLLQPADPFTSLGIAAVLLSLQNCYAVCDLGLQLSFAATVGVLCAARVFPPVRMDEQEEHPWRFRLRRVCTALLVPLFAAIFNSAASAVAWIVSQWGFGAHESAGHVSGRANRLPGADLRGYRSDTCSVWCHTGCDAAGRSTGQITECHCVLYGFASGGKAGFAESIYCICGACLRGGALVCLAAASSALGSTGALCGAGTVG